jgi:MTH538 TIR-like domain (DUF1863)
MKKKKVYVSFDNVEDRRLKAVIATWIDVDGYEFVFGDVSAKDIKDWNAKDIQAVLTPQIKKTELTLVLIGRFSNTVRKNAESTGSKNWVNFEIAQSKANNNKLVAIKLSKQHTTPDELQGVETVVWADSILLADVVAALNAAGSSAV